MWTTGWETGRNCGGPRPECVFHMFLLFSLVSGDISCWTALAASGHLACDAVFILSLPFSLLWGPKKFYKVLRNPFSAVLYIYRCRIAMYSHLTKHIESGAGSLNFRYIFQLNSLFHHITHQQLRTLRAQCMRIYVFALVIRI
jgi:hypothetical protein